MVALFDVGPLLTLADEVHLFHGEPVFGREFNCSYSGGLCRAHCSHIIRSDVPSAVFLSASDATLFAAIQHVLPVGSQEQVIGANARRIVAAMTDLQSVGNFSEVDDPRKTVRSPGVADPPAPGEVPVSVFGSGTRPEPAVVGSFDAVPESFNHHLVEHLCNLELRSNTFNNAAVVR